MTNLASKIRREKRVRLHLKAITARPRLSVFRSNAHITASIIDDQQHLTRVTVTDSAFKGSKTERSREVGAAIAKAALASGIKQVAYDRGSYRYHGRVKALAEAARSEGLEF